ncbi:long-chain fatty acid-CoA ligase, partial [Coemansia furcata]
MALDGVSLWRVVASMCANHIYTLNLETFPLVQTTSAAFLGSCALAVGNHFMWFFYFIQNLAHPFGHVCALMFFCVWMVPLALFVSVTPVDASLPSARIDKTPTRRFHTTADRVVDRAQPDITNIYAGLLRGRDARPDYKSLGKRDVLGTVTEEKTVQHKVDGKLEQTTKEWSYFKLSEYKWMSYAQVYEFTKNLGAGYVNLGLKPKSRVLIYAPTSREWQLCAFGAFSQSMQIVTAYDTLGESGLLHAMNQAKVDLVFLKADQMPTFARIMDEIETVKHVVYYQDLYGMPKGCEEAIEKVRAKFGVSTIDEVHDLGKANPVELTLADGQDIAMVMYTSGSTGKPKGVLICHQGVMSVAGGIHEFIQPYLEYYNDVVLSYLPLSHVLAFFVDVYCIYSGLAVGYGTP